MKCEDCEFLQKHRRLLKSKCTKLDVTLGVMYFANRQTGKFEPALIQSDNCPFKENTDEPNAECT